MSLPILSHDEFIAEYTKYLSEISDRLWEVIKITQNLEREICTNGNGAIDLDLAFLQTRKVLELLMFATLVAHRLDNSQIIARLDKEYSPLLIAKQLKKLNERFFPTAITFSDSGLGDGQTILDYVETTRLGPCLKPGELRKIYGELCGDRAHAMGEYNRDDWTKIKDEAMELRLAAHKIGSLLLFHQIIVSDDFSIIAQIRNADTGAPRVSILRLNREETRRNKAKLGIQT